MALEGSTGFGLSALRLESATVTCARSSNIFIGLTLFKKLASFQGLAGRAGKGISFNIKVKASLAKIPFSCRYLLSLLQ